MHKPTSLSFSLCRFEERRRRQGRPADGSGRCARAAAVCHAAAGAAGARVPPAACRAASYCGGHQCGGDVADHPRWALGWGYSAAAGGLRCAGCGAAGMACLLACCWPGANPPGRFILRLCAHPPMLDLAARLGCQPAQVPAVSALLQASAMSWMPAAPSSGCWRRLLGCHALKCDGSARPARSSARGGRGAPAPATATGAGWAALLVRR